MKGFFVMIKKLTNFTALLMALVFGLASQASAVLDLTGVTFPMVDVEAVASLILAAAAAIWVIYKVLQLIRRG